MKFKLEFLWGNVYFGCSYCFQAFNSSTAFGMKKIYFFALMMAFAGLLSAQSFVVTPNLTVNETVDPRNSVDTYVHFTNVTTESLQLRWQISYENFPSQWIVTLCDNGSCFSVPHASAENMTAIAAGDSAFLKGTFTPVMTPGLGTVKVLVWDVLDSAGTAVEVTMNVNAVVSAVSANQLDELFTVSPSPANEMLHLRAVNGNLDKGDVKLYDLKGQVVMQKQVLAGLSADLDVRSLAPGIYMMRYETKAGSMTKKVVIAR